MRAMPVKLVSKKDEDGEMYRTYEQCEITEVTHIELKMPLEFKPLQKRVIPVVVGTRTDTPCDGAWLWNGDVNKPTVTPSILTEFNWGPEKTKHRCHSFVTNGLVRFLGDSSHKWKGFTLKLLEV